MHKLLNEGYNLSTNTDDIETKVLNNFYNNLKFIKRVDENLHAKLELLNQAINSGIYNENFVLEYIQEKNSFDILDTSTNTFIYEKKSEEINRKLVDQIDFSKKQIFSINNNKLFDRYKKEDIELETNEKYDLLSKDLLKDLSKFYDIFEEREEKDFKEIEKVLFLGTFLGEHLIDIAKKLKAKNFFIYEENLEIFRLSLFVTDYRIFEKSHVIFCIMENEDVFNFKLDEFIEIDAYSNYNIKYSRLKYISNETINKFLTRFHISKNTYFDYTKMLYDVVYSLSENLRKERRFLSLGNNQFGMETPVMYVGAGPSLSEKIDWLRQNQDNFLIVAMGATYKKLIENSIRVDLIVTVDPKYSILNSSHFKKDDIEVLKEIPVLASVNTPQKILKRFNQEKLFLYETLIPIKENAVTYTGASIGEIGLSLLLDLNFKNIYLLGIDLTINKKDGNTHFDDYSNTKKEKIKIDEVNTIFNDGKSKNLDKELITVFDNAGDEAYTTRMFALSISSYVNAIYKKKRSWQNIYNLSKKAAKIYGINYLEENDYKFIKMDSISKQKYALNELLYKNSSSVLSQKEQNFLEKNTIFAKRFKTKLFNNVFTFIEFRTHLEKFIEIIIANGDNILNLILANHSNIVLPYIFYNCNIENLDNEREKINKASKEFKKQIKKIIYDYSYYLENIDKK